MMSHEPVRPGWSCQGCRQAWPCPDGRRELLAAPNKARLSLSMYLAGQFLAACQELPTTPAGELYQRFLGWGCRG